MPDGILSSTMFYKTRVVNCTKHSCKIQNNHNILTLPANLVTRVSFTSVGGLARVPVACCLPASGAAPPVGAFGDHIQAQRQIIYIGKMTHSIIF